MRSRRGGAESAAAGNIPVGKTPHYIPTLIHFFPFITVTDSLGDTSFLEVEARHRLLALSEAPPYTPPSGFDGVDDSFPTGAWTRGASRRLLRNDDPPLYVECAQTRNTRRSLKMITFRKDLKLAWTRQVMCGLRRSKSVQ